MLSERTDNPTFRLCSAARGGQEAKEERWAREKEREERRTASDPVLVISGLG